MNKYMNKYIKTAQLLSICISIVTCNQGQASPSLIPVDVLATNSTTYKVRVQAKPFGALSQALATKEITLPPKKKDKRSKIFVDTSKYIYTSASWGSFNTLGLAIEELIITAKKQVNWYTTETVGKISIMFPGSGLPGSGFWPLDITNWPQLVLFITPDESPIGIKIELYQVKMTTTLQKRIAGIGKFAFGLPWTYIDALFENRPKSVEEFIHLFKTSADLIPLTVDTQRSTQQHLVFKVNNKIIPKATQRKDI